ncbi:MAG: hypothetical protein HZA19_02430, partial [Nitrospirae bacterium]|nr:hypothetical protein [Nitrospirota bacterium]
MTVPENTDIQWGIQKKLVTSILVAGLFFLCIGLYLTYTYVKRALTVTIGANFEEIAKKTAEG